jgi:hypothetical protein
MMSAMAEVQEEEAIDDVGTQGIYPHLPRGDNGRRRGGSGMADRVTGVIKGPIDQYQRWVSEGKLRDDEYQRGTYLSYPPL